MSHLGAHGGDGLDERGRALEIVIRIGANAHPKRRAPRGEVKTIHQTVPREVRRWPYSSGYLERADVNRPGRTRRAVDVDRGSARSSPMIDRGRPAPKAIVPGVPVLKQLRWRRDQ